MVRCSQHLSSMAATDMVDMVINFTVMAASCTRAHLKTSLDDEYSLIKTCHETVHVPLPPAYVGSEAKGIRTLLESWKGQYVERLHGVLLGYENIKFVEASGTIIDDQPFVHQDIIGDFQVFKPETGSIVRAYINRMSRNHVGCLVHDWINLSILLPPNPAPELSRYLNMGQEILCKITSLSVYRHNALRLRGSITSDCLELMQDTVPALREECSDELVEYESNFGDDWNEEGGSDGEPSGRLEELCYLEPDEDFAARSGRPQGDSSPPVEPTEPPVLPEKPKRRKARVKQEVVVQAHADRSGGDTAASYDSATTAGAHSDAGSGQAKKRKRKHADDCESSPESKKKKKKKDREPDESIKPVQDAIPAGRKSGSSGLVEHGSSYEDSGSEEWGLDGGPSSQQKLRNLEPGKDASERSGKLRVVQDNLATSMEPPEVPALLEKPRKKKIRVKQEMLSSQSSGDTAPSQDSETSAAVSSDTGSLKAKKRKQKHMDEDEGPREAKKRKKEKKKKKDREPDERREKKKKHKKEKKLKADMDGGASTAASLSSARLSSAETESMPDDDSEPMTLDSEFADAPVKKEKKHKKKIENGPAFEATLDSSCLEHNQKVKKKKKRKD